ncbi:MAG: hypothetical protein JSV96_13430 [Candidatus Aminicenantes bacterium]|nr:MAG: hypothetical protein JSV96_13430 [Candidatus Aminicenantes bacterium]
MQKDMLKNIMYIKSPLIAVLVFFISAVVFSQYGFVGTLVRDDANYVYSGQQMAQGIPPYKSIFDYKGPIAPMISGAGATVARLFNTDDILIIRITFLIVSCFVVVGIYFLGTILFESSRTGFLSALAFIGFYGFGRHAASGPRAKTPMVLFEVLSLLLTAKKKWFWAGICGSLAFLTWQPTVIYLVVTIFLAFTQSEQVRVRARSVLLAVSGALIPIIAVSIYFLLNGAFLDFIDGTVLFNIKNLEHGPFSLLGNLGEPISAVYKAYTIMTIPIILGFFMLFVIYMWRIKLHGKKIIPLVSKDHFAAFLLTFPFPVLWSVLYFQSYPDFYVLLPYAAIGFGWLLYLAIDALNGIEEIGAGLKKAFYLVLCIGLIGGAAIVYRRASENGLVEQRQWAHQIKHKFEPDLRLVSIGAPEVLVLLHQTNPNPYVYIVNGIDKRIDEKTQEGFNGWLEELERYDPSVIAFGQTRGRFKPKLLKWLETHFQETKIGDWTLFIKNSNLK